MEINIAGLGMYGMHLYAPFPLAMVGVITKYDITMCTKHGRYQHLDTTGVVAVRGFMQKKQ